MRRRLAAVLWLACAGVGEAAHYRPLHCDRPAPYAGPPLHAPLGAEGAPTSGSLSGPEAPEVATRLQTALQRGLAASPGVKSIAIAVVAPGVEAGAAAGRPLTTRPGHSGGAPGVSAIVVWSPRDAAFAAVSLSGEGSAAAFANTLLKALASPSVGR